MTSARTFEEYLTRRISPGTKFSQLLEYPQFIEIETVNVCNARCPMCTIGDWEVARPTMRDDVFQKIAHDLIANAGKVRRVSLYRDGEPLIDTRLPERIRLLKNGGIPEVAISTNVALLDEDKATNILEAGIDLVILSIDSLVAEVYESIRVRLKFDEVMHNALSFIRARDEGGYSTRIWVRMIRQESNQDEWEGFERYWKSRLRETDRVYFHNIFNWGGQLSNFVPIASSYEPGLPCVALWSLMVFTVNGSVPLCNVDYNVRQPMGDITQNSISEIWHSMNFDRVRAAHLNRRKSELPMCATCNVWEAHDSDDFFTLAKELSGVTEIGGLGQ